MQLERLHAGGLVPFSTVDYPGRLSAVVFCQGCPWRCRYCHNSHLQPFGEGTIAWAEIERFLASRRGLLEAVVFSGGEPTAQPALSMAMRAVRALGFEVALHTAGIHPVRLQEVLPLVSWVGLDIKAPFDARYDTLTARHGSAGTACRALEIVVASGVEYEIRTTVHPALLPAAALEEMRRGLARLGAREARLQPFRPRGCRDAALLAGNAAVS